MATSIPVITAHQVDCHLINKLAPKAAGKQIKWVN